MSILTKTFGSPTLYCFSHFTGPEYLTEQSKITYSSKQDTLEGNSEPHTTANNACKPVSRVIAFQGLLQEVGQFTVLFGVFYLRAVQHKLAGPLQDPAGARGLGVGRQRFFGQAVHSALHGALHLQQPALNSTYAAKHSGTQKLPPCVSDWFALAAKAASNIHVHTTPCEGGLTMFFMRINHTHTWLSLASH